MEIPVQLGINNKLSFGVFHITPHQNSIPVVLVMCYGLNGDRVEQHRMSVKAGRYASSLQVNFLRFDYCNQGVSQGAFQNVTIASKTDDVLHWIKNVRAYFENEQIKIYLIGFSDGARVAVNAAIHSEDINGLILWNPIVKLPNSQEESANPHAAKDRLYMDRKTRNIYKKLLGVKLNTTILNEMKNDNTFSSLINYKKPILYVFGSEDRFTKYLQRVIYHIGIYDLKKMTSIPLMVLTIFFQVLILRKT